MPPPKSIKNSWISFLAQTSYFSTKENLQQTMHVVDCSIFPKYFLKYSPLGDAEVTLGGRKSRTLRHWCISCMKMALCLEANEEEENPPTWFAHRRLKKLSFVINNNGIAIYKKHGLKTKQVNEKIHEHSGRRLPDLWAKYRLPFPLLL